MKIEVQTLLPHRPPMVFIDRLVSCSLNETIAQKNFNQGDIGLGNDGVVDEVILVECLAQTCAASLGYQARLAGEEPSEGMLVGIKNFKFFKSAREGQTIELMTRIQHAVGHFRIIEGMASVSGEIIAKGELKLYIVDHEPDKQT